MPQRPDLHCHSTTSDGTLTPAELAARAHACGVDLWALTDHDSLDGQAAARDSAQALGLAWVSGVEVSVSFLGQTIHVVGLGVDIAHPGLLQLLQANRHSRIPRAQRMAQALEALGIADAYAGALQYSATPEQMSRTHFARYLVEIGRCSNMAEVFRRYLGDGKPGYVPQQWASLEDTLAAIAAAGGIAVLAHPGRYKLSPLQEGVLLDSFAQHGGHALEVATSAHSPAQLQHYAAIARARGWAASCGSDFHSPQESRYDLGQCPTLPPDLEPVWKNL